MSKTSSAHFKALDACAIAAGWSSFKNDKCIVHKLGLCGVLKLAMHMLTLALQYLLSHIHFSVAYMVTLVVHYLTWVFYRENFIEVKKPMLDNTLICHYWSKMYFSVYNFILCQKSN